MHERAASGPAHQRPPGDWDRLRSDVASLDPLGLDHAFRRLPQLGGAERARWALEHLRRGVSAAPADDADLAVLHACLRDLGLLAAALRAQGVEATTAWPALDPLLSRLGSATAHVPRDTILHYAAFNPPGARRRRHTSDPQEEALIDATADATDAVVGAAAALWRATGTPMGSSGFLDGCDEARAHLARLATAAGTVARAVSPQFLTETLWRHRAALLVGGRHYDGAGPSQLPTYVVDDLLWAGRTDDRPYRSFVDRNLPYALVEMRHLYAGTQGTDSLTTTFLRLTAAGEAPPWAHRVRSALLATLDELIRYRRIQHAFAVRLRASRRGDGSAEVARAGLSPALLTEMLRMTESARTELLGAGTAAHLSAA